MRIESAASPNGPIHQGTIFECNPFNFLFDGEHEWFSFYVPDDAVATAHKLAGRPAELKGWACTFVGRKMDLARCVSVGMRVVQVGADLQIELRLKFKVPWYLERMDIKDA